MSTIQELIDRGECVLGVTILTSSKSKKIRYTPICLARPGVDRSLQWLGLYSDGRIDWRSPSYGHWQAYVEAVEMEDRWLWAANGSSSQLPHLTSYSFCTEGDPRAKGKIKLEWSKTQFPKENK